MARTPFFRAFLRSVKSARERGVDRGAGLSRREFLRTSAAAATLAAFPVACSSSDDSDSRAAKGDPRVIVIGGGMAGLHAAYRLGEVGVRAEVFEATSQTGGRIRSDRTTFPDGMHCELGGELIDTGHTTMRDLATELGIELLDYSTETGLSPLVSHMLGKRLTEQETVDAIAPILPKVDEALEVLTDPDAYISYRDPNGAAALDAMSLRAWLMGAGASDLARAIFETAYIIEYGLEPDACNSLNFLTLVGTETAPFAMFGESDELFHAKTGNDTYITSLTQKLPADGFRYGHKLRALAKASDGRVVATFDTDGGTKEETADRVIVAIPFSILRDVDLTKLALPEPKMKAIREIGYGNNTKLMVGFSKRPWRDQGSDGGTYSDLGYQSTWETSRLQPGPSGILTAFSGGNLAVTNASADPNLLRDAFLGQLDKVFPGAAAASNGKVARAGWPTNPFTKGSYSSYAVGQYTTIAGAEGEPFENIHFAGEHTSRAAQGYMEGAAQTGAIAAVEVATALGKMSRVETLPEISKKIWNDAVTAQQDERT